MEQITLEDRSKIQPNQLALELIKKIKSNFVRPDGLLARNYPPGERTLFDNFDDIVPFFIYFGETDFLLQQAHTIRKKGENFFSLCAEHGVLSTSHVDEWFGGFYALWKATGDVVVKAMLDESLEFLKTKIGADYELPAAFFADGSVSPYYECWSAGLIETFCEMANDYPDLLDRAQAIMKHWISSEYFKAHSLFPYRIFENPVREKISRLTAMKFEPISHTKPPPKPRGGVKAAWQAIKLNVRFQKTTGYYSQLMKSNSTPAFSLLALYSKTKDATWIGLLERWLDATLTNFCDSSNFVYEEYLPLTGIGVKRGRAATPAFILVDVICDGVWIDHNRFERHMPTAKKILDAYWECRLPSGLIPLQPDGLKAHLDTQVDFSVSFRRYADLSGDSSYKEKAAELVYCAIKAHKTELGYSTFSNPEGRPEPPQVDPKYNALFLKALINLETMDQNLYPALYDLFKDR